ncbi:MAG: hypothetical protein AB7P14_19685 [Blastocatellales bacterium]
MGKASSTLFAFLLLLSSAAFAQTPSKEASTTIAGVVTLNGEAMRNVTVTIQAMNSPGSSQRAQPRAKTDANGRFRLTGIAAGQFIIGALAPAYVNERSPSLGLNPGTLLGQIITVADGETIENLEIKLKRGGVITGRVTDADGEPVIETVVRLAPVADRNAPPPPPPMNPNAYRTDDRGIYRIFGLPAGKYKVSVGLPVRQGAFSMQTSRSYIPETFHPDATNEAEAKIIEVKEGDEVTDVDIKAAEAQRTYEISGRVVDAETGKPVVGIGLSFGSFNEAGRLTGSMSGGWRTDTNGEFQIMGARQGKHAVFVENRDGKSDLYSEPTPVEVFNGDVSGVEIRAMHGNSISGTVIIEGSNDPAIQSKRNQIILITTPDVSSFYSGSRNAKVNADGSFRFTGLPVGRLRFGTSIVPNISLQRIEQNGVPLKDSVIEIHSGEQVNNLRLIFGYGDGTIRGQLKIVGGELPEGIKLAIGCKGNTVGTRYFPSTPLDMRNQFLFTGLPTGEYELYISASFPNGRPPSGVVEKIFPRLARARQYVSVSNGNETQVTFTVDISQE